MGKKSYLVQVAFMTERLKKTTFNKCTSFLHRLQPLQLNFERKQWTDTTHDSSSCGAWVPPPPQEASKRCQVSYS